MSELTKILLTIAGTIIGGVVVFAASQLLQRLVLEPIVAQRKAVAEIDVALTYWAWAYANPAEQEPGRTLPARDKASEDLRKACSNLIGATNAIRCWRLASRVGAVPPDSAREAGRFLIGLSNSLYHTPGNAVETGRHNRASAKEIRRLLDLKLTATQ